MLYLVQVLKCWPWEDCRSPLWSRSELLHVLYNWFQSSPMAAPQSQENISKKGQNTCIAVWGVREKICDKQSCEHQGHRGGRQQWSRNSPAAHGKTTVEQGESVRRKEWQRRAIMHWPEMFLLLSVCWRKQRSWEWHREVKPGKRGVNVLEMF